MKKKFLLPLLIAAFVVVLGGSYLLYNHFSGDVDPDPNGGAGTGITDPNGGNTDPTQSGGDGPITFLITDNFGWGSAYVYAWDANGTALCGEWPGAAQAETITNGYGETQFRCTVPEGAVGVILNNGNGAQTEDITDFGTYEGYWMNGKKNSQGHYLVTGWNS